VDLVNNSQVLHHSGKVWNANAIPTRSTGSPCTAAGDLEALSDGMTGFWVTSSSLWEMFKYFWNFVREPCSKACRRTISKSKSWLWSEANHSAQMEIGTSLWYSSIYCGTWSPSLFVVCWDVPERGANLALDRSMRSMGDLGDTGRFSHQANGHVANERVNEQDTTNNCKMGKIDSRRKKRECKSQRGQKRRDGPVPSLSIIGRPTLKDRAKSHNPHHNGIWDDGISTWGQVKEWT